MRYKKGVNEKLDRAFSGSTQHGMNIKLAEEVLFYRKMFHWEYIEKEDVEKMHRRVEEVITHTSCCAENMDIQRFIVTLKSSEEVSIHVCDGEPKLAEKLYEDIKSMWTDVEYGTNE